MLRPSTNFSNTVMRRYVILVVVCTTLSVLFYLYSHYSETGMLPILQEHAKRMMVAALLTNLLGLIISQTDSLFDKFISWRTVFMLRFMIGFVANVTLAVGFIFFCKLYLFELDRDEIIKLSVLLTISIFIYEIFYGWFYSYRYYAITQVEQLRTERWQLELQFELLKNQISPHYLFNCLNTISSLLYKDSHTAEKFIRRMADTFRYVLANQKKKLVTLQQEVDFIKAYYFLLQVRFEHHLQLEINLPKNILDTPIPPLTLQLLVENAVKHNQITKDLPLLVYITAKDNTHIIVTNTKTAVQKPVSSFKVGIENIRQRYRFFSEEKILIRDEDKFSVQLPVLRLTTKNTELA